MSAILYSELWCYYTSFHKLFLFSAVLRLTFPSKSQQSDGALKSFQTMQILYILSQKLDGVLIRECCHTCMSSFDIEIMLVIKIIQFLTQTVFNKLLKKTFYIMFLIVIVVFLTQELMNEFWYVFLE